MQESYQRKKQPVPLLWGILPLSVALFALTAGILMRNGHLGFLLSCLKQTDVVWEKPRLFGPFHLSFLLLTAVLTVCFCWMTEKSGKTAEDRITFSTGILLLLMETYKQFSSFFVLCGGRYDYGIFPFQFCSIPLYLFLLTPLLPEGRGKSVLYRFLALYGTVGGMLVIGDPALTDRVASSVHTLLWHTVMVSVGLMLLYAERCGKHYLRELTAPTAVFLLSVLIATLLNVFLRPYSLSSPNPLNLFYLSPYEQTYFLLIGDLQANFGWPAALLGYILLFIFLGATALWLLGLLHLKIRSAVTSRTRRGDVKHDVKHDV